MFFNYYWEKKLLLIFLNGMDYVFKIECGVEEFVIEKFKIIVKKGEK